MQRLFACFARGAMAGLALCAGLALLPSVTCAQDVPSGPRSHRNVYLAGGEVRSAVPVQGDFVAAGGRVLVDQAVGGDLLAAGGAVEVRAPVAEDARVVGGDVTLRSRVGGELFATGGHVALGPEASVGGRTALYGGTVSIAGRLGGELEVAAQKVTLDGEVQGDVRINAEDIELGPAARIGGGLRYVSGSELKMAPGARIGGVITHDADAAAQGRGGPAAHRGAEGFFLAGGVVSYLALLACAAVFLLLAPVFAAQAPRRIQAHPWRALGAGLLALVAVPLLAALLFITVLGIPLGIAVMALYPVLLLAGFVVGVLFLGGLLPPALKRPAATGLRGTLVYFALALLMVLLVARVPFAGALAMGLVSLAGLGACLLEIHARRKGPPAGAPSAEGPSLPLGDTPRHA
ncbi:bactofilin family protein [Ramlibacter sp. AN1133]|uniref:bactofilin family protein n=1 Tax=Ramlibacter sp. AN1133 TaxID=3133429 RepID=UPI0030BD4720